MLGTRLMPYIVQAEEFQNGVAEILQTFNALIDLTVQIVLKPAVGRKASYCSLNNIVR